MANKNALSSGGGPVAMMSYRARGRGAGRCGRRPCRGWLCACWSRGSSRCASGLARRRDRTNRTNWRRSRRRCSGLHSGGHTSRRGSRRLRNNFRNPRRCCRRWSRMSRRSHGGGRRNRRCGGRGWLYSRWGHGSLRRCSHRGGPHPRRLRCNFLRFFFGLCRSFRVSLGFCNSLDTLANLHRDIGRNGARVRFLFGYAKTGQKVNDGLGLDLQLAR